MDGPDVADPTEMLRLAWDPDDIVNGKMQPGAFKSDLKGDPERYLSVDRTDVLVPGVVRCVATRQRTKARQMRQEAPEPVAAGIPKRFYSMGLIFTAADARAISVEFEGKVYLNALKVGPEAVPEGGEPCPLANPAHCRVDNVSGVKAKGFLQALQTKLAAIFQSPRPIDEILAEHGEMVCPYPDSRPG